jgi:hypothetical protein
MGSLQLICNSLVCFYYQSTTFAANMLYRLMVDKTAAMALKYFNSGTAFYQYTAKSHCAPVPRLQQQQ